jgi:hypothetical protein
VYKHVSFFSTFFDEVVGWLEGVTCILCVAVVEVEYKVFDVLWILKMQIDPWTYGSYFVVLEFLKVVREVVATDPYLVHITLFI